MPQNRDPSRHFAHLFISSRATSVHNLAPRNYSSTMSSTVQPSSSTSNFQSIFEKALEEYKKKTRKDLTTHPLAAEIRGCDSPEKILNVLEDKANELNQSQSSDERLIKWLKPTVNILNALSATLGQAAGSVSCRSSPRHFL